jgi:hypothetical protein
MSEAEAEELPMYCCLFFSYAIKYGLIKIDYERNAIEIPLKSSLPEGEKKEIWDKLYKQHISNIHPDYFSIIHCPWCGLHMNHVVDFDKCSYIHAGQYSSKEDWER